ncbi:MAG: anaerobic carbon-monoxide dehydrogenase catalytic subunit [Clostridia bacterium]|nr:anaerobic carbon-monoxide dehydrogenase catalytic subunit [Clostridia bacterium]
MEKLRKKTSDADLEQLLVVAARQGVPLSWDRYEGMVPLCGFGRLSLCCSLCSQGPCRVNPFEAEDRETVCGRSRAELVAANFLRLIADGVTSIINYAGNNTELPPAVEARVVNKDLLPGATINELLQAARMYIEGVDSVEAYSRAAARLALAGYCTLANQDEKVAVNEVEAGIGALKEDQANLLIIGAIPAAAMDSIKAAATGVNLVGMCGAEHGIAIAGNYGSQEAVLFSGLVDAILVGRACVTPGFLNTAKKLGLSVFSIQQDAINAAVNAAREHYSQGRQNLVTTTAWQTEQATVGYTPAIFQQIKPAKIEAINSKYPIKGCVILSGCNNVKTTQNESIVEQAKELVRNDVLVLATGCAAAALAKAGLMDGDQANRFAGQGLVDYLGALAAAAGVGRMPAALHCGTCWQLPAAVDIAAALGLPTFASFPEVSLPAAWSSALALAALGIPTYVGPVLPIEGTPAAVAALAEVVANNLRAPITDALTPAIAAQKVTAALLGEK